MIDRRLVVFGTVGVAATGLFVLFAVLLHSWFGWNRVLADIGAYSLAIFCSYSGNTILGHGQKLAVASFGRFLMVSVFGMAVSSVVSAAGIVFGVSHLLTIYAILVIVPAFSFTLHLMWTYRPPLARDSVGGKSVALKSGVG